MSKIQSTPAQAAQAEAVRNARSFVLAGIAEAEAAQAADLSFRTYALSVAVAVSKGAKPAGIALATKDGLSDLAEVAPKGTVYTTATAVGHVMRTGRVLAKPVGTMVTTADGETEATPHGRKILSDVRKACQGEAEGGIGVDAVDAIIRKAATQAEAVTKIREAVKAAREAVKAAEAEAAEAMAEALAEATAEGMSLADLLRRAVEMIAEGAEVDAEASDLLTSLYSQATATA